MPHEKPSQPALSAPRPSATGEESMARETRGNATEAIMAALARIGEHERLLADLARRLALAATRERAQAQATKQGNDRLLRRCDELERENEFLRLGAALAPDRHEAAALKGTLTGLLREIDKCVTLLSDAPPEPFAGERGSDSLRDITAG